MAAGNQLTNLVREAIADVETGVDGEMWTMVYGQLQLEATNPDRVIEVFGEHYNYLNKAAANLVLILAHMYADEAGVTPVEAIDQAQATMHAAYGL